jgi:hypothetical protein
MASFIEVQTTDVNGDPLTPDAVEITLDGSSELQTMAPASSGGQQAEVTGAQKIKMHVTAKNYWDVTQNFDFTDGNPPTVSPDGNQATYNPYDYEINLDPPTLHLAANNDWIMTVHVRLSHLRDCETKVRAVLKNSHDTGWAEKWDTEMDFDLTRSVTTRLVQEWILGDEGSTGTDCLSTTTTQGPPGGTLYFLERPATPKLILVWISEKADVIGMWYEEMPVPINYQIFFHPAIPWPDHPPGEEAYPWNFDSLNLPHRYLMGRPPQADNPNPDQFDILHGTSKNKHMLNMVGASGAGVVFVYPVGNAASWLNDITNQANALLLLQEINHFIRRRAAAALALHPIGRIAVSGFSFGYNGPARLAISKKVADFDDKWDEIYNFDGNDNSFISPTIAWLHGRTDKQSMSGNRRLRVYTQTGMWDVIATLKPFKHAVEVKRFSAREVESYAGTLVKVPSAFWSKAFGVADFDHIHQAMPALFLHHAMIGWFYVV